MAITHTSKVTNLRILNNSDNIISEVEVTTKSVDDSNPSELTIEAEETYDVDTSGGTSAVGFTTFSNLTEEKVLTWITSDPKRSRKNDKIKLRHENWISSVKNPPTPPEVDKSIPL